MGKANRVVTSLRKLPPRPRPSADAMRVGVRQTRPDGTIVVRDWQRPSKDVRPSPPPVVDRLPSYVTD
jgi:hypothetical protein